MQSVLLSAVLLLAAAAPSQQAEPPSATGNTDVINDIKPMIVLLMQCTLNDLVSLVVVRAMHPPKRPDLGPTQKVQLHIVLALQAVPS